MKRKFLVLFILIVLFLAYVLTPGDRPYAGKIRTFFNNLMAGAGINSKPENKICQYCNKGYNTCRDCQGSGDAYMVHCSICNLLCEVSIPNKKTGLSTYKCRKCKKTYKAYVPCETCNGKGRVKCEKCNGTGVSVQ